MNDTIWLKVKKDIEKKIITGFFSTADKCYSINEMMDIYKISRETARRVIKSLELDEIIYFKPNIGFYFYPYTQQKLKDKYISELDENLYTIIKEWKGIDFKEEEIVHRIYQILERLKKENNSDGY